MNPIFSIIIPVYNVAPYLRECLDSLLAQTVNDPASHSYAAASWEAICVDDGSTDGSAAILDEYAAKDSRFRVIHQDNAGVSQARNAALAIANGSWIGFLDGDDAFAPWYLGVLFEQIGKKSVDWVRISGFIDANNDIPNSPPSCRPKRVWEGNRVGEFLWNDVTRIDGGYGWLNWFRREFVANHRFITGVKFGEDTIFQLQLIESCRSTAIVDAPGYIYRCQRIGSASNMLRCFDVMPLLNVAARFADKVRMIDRRENESIIGSIAFLAEKTFRRVIVGDRGSYLEQFMMSKLFRDLNHCGVKCFVSARFVEKIAWRVFLWTGSTCCFRLLTCRSVAFVVEKLHPVYSLLRVR